MPLFDIISSFAKAGVAEAELTPVQDGAVSSGVISPKTVTANAPNPLAGKQCREMRATAPNDPNTTLMCNIGSQPQFGLIGIWTVLDNKGGVPGAMKGIFKSVDKTAPGALPLLAIRFHMDCNPGKDTAVSAQREKQIGFKAYDDLAAGIGNRPIVLALEFDVLGTFNCVSPAHRAARWEVLQYGVNKLSKLPNTIVYLDAGAADWQSPQQVAQQLQKWGIHKVRGFMLNASHQDWTGNNIRYGEKISRALGGNVPFVINTALAGRGSVRWKQHNNRIGTAYCNVKQRGLGLNPTTNTHNRLVDAYVWMTQPGISDGSGPKCNYGPQVGYWWQDYALELARNQTNWIDQPKGYQYGWPKGKYTAKYLAGGGYTP